MTFFGKKDNKDTLSVSMQDEIIRISTLRTGNPLSKELIAKVRQGKWSYMGLEMIIDTVKSMDVNEIETYLSKLE